MLEFDGGEPSPQRAQHSKGDLDEFANEARRFRDNRSAAKGKPKNRHVALWVMLVLLLLALVFFTWETVQWQSGGHGMAPPATSHELAAG